MTTTADVVDANDGLCSLREAVSSANDNAASGPAAGECPAGAADPAEDTIVLDAATYGLDLGVADENLNAGGDLDVGTSGSSGPLRIEGVGAPATTIDALHGDALEDRAIHKLLHPLTVAELRITGGEGVGADQGNDAGGAIFATGAGPLVVQDAQINGNSSDYGGGAIFVSSGAPSATIERSVLSQNEMVNESIFASGGGAIFSQAPLTVIDSTLTDNSAVATNGVSPPPEGGAIAANGDSVTLTRTELSLNEAGDPMTATTGSGGGGLSFTPNLNAVLAVTDSQIADNYSEGPGGGLLVRSDFVSSTLTAAIDKSLIGSNLARSNGGGIVAPPSAGTVNVEIDSSLVTGNHAEPFTPGTLAGGGIAVIGPKNALDVAGSAISGNGVDAGIATGVGGGVALDDDSTARIVGSELIANTAGGASGDGFGGGVFVSSTSADALAISNSTISGNAAVGPTLPAGGGIAAVDGSTDLTFSTLAGNSASAGWQIALNGPATVNAAATIIADSGPAACSSPTIVSGGYNVEAGNSCLAAPATGDMQNQSAELLELGAYGAVEAGPPNATAPLRTHELGLSSPARDLVPAVDCVDDQMTTVDADQRGFARPFPAAGNCDAGAYEIVEPCLGRGATVVGTAASETIGGTSADDVIAAGAGDDSISGGAGNDRICAGAGADTVNAGDGDDSADGGAGSDTLSFAGGGAISASLSGGAATGQGTDAIADFENLIGTGFGDTLVGDGAVNLLNGLAGNDRISGLDRGDRLLGLAGDDRLFGGGGRDLLFGAAGRDLLKGQGGRDVADGGGGPDRLFGQAGADRLVGRSGHDRLFGGAQRDLLFGGPGRDLLWGQAGRPDLCNGGPGRDRRRTRGCERVRRIP